MVKIQTIRRKHVPIIVTMAGRVECPLPLSAPAGGSGKIFGIFKIQGIIFT